MWAIFFLRDPPRLAESQTKAKMWLAHEGVRRQSVDEESRLVSAPKRPSRVIQWMIALPFAVTLCVISRYTYCDWRWYTHLPYDIVVTMCIGLFLGHCVAQLLSDRKPTKFRVIANATVFVMAIFNGSLRHMGFAISGHMSTAILIAAAALMNQRAEMYYRFVYLVPIAIAMPMRLAVLDCPYGDKLHGCHRLAHGFDPLCHHSQFALAVAVGLFEAMLLHMAVNYRSRLEGKFPSLKNPLGGQF